MALQRIVCFKFKNNTDPEAIQQHMNDFKALKEKIPQIQSYSAGMTISGNNGAAPEYDGLHYLTFHSEKDMEEYSQHPDHQHFIARNKLIWEKVLVLNSVIDSN